MNQRSLMEFSWSTHLPYPVEVNNNGLAFQTDYGITYHLTFETNARYFPNEPFGENCVTLSIIPIIGYTYAGAYTSRGDIRVEVTIIDQLKQLFAANRLLVINYSCDLANHLERHRSIVFGRWYVHHLEPTGIVRIKRENKSERIYAAVLYHENNPYRADIERVFSELFSGK